MLTKGSENCNSTKLFHTSSILDVRFPTLHKIVSKILPWYSPLLPAMAIVGQPGSSNRVVSKQQPLYGSCLCAMTTRSLNVLLPSIAKLVVVVLEVVVAASSSLILIGGAHGGSRLRTTSAQNNVTKSTIWEA